MSRIWVKYCLGLEFTRYEKEITVKQKGYINDVLNRFGMLECKPVSTPLEPGLKLVKQEVGTGDCQYEAPYRELGRGVNVFVGGDET
ncbi:unnamed protein product [Lasius platythorax]|uniref:Reverse transcriptase n=2 Tax=Lasius TaxID=488720 RepID=A0AAV2NDH3_9HYME|nr:putative mitochondrial protein g00810-like protein [Lasius niger]